MLQGWQPEPPEVKHLNALSICQYVYAVCAGVCGTGMTYYPSFLKWAFASSPTSSATMSAEAMKTVTMVSLFYAAVIYAVAICSVVAGAMIRRRKGWLFVLILSGVDLVFVPFGTALGIGCLVTLTKPHVKAMFVAPATETPPPQQ